jgi:hypothetical protein
MIIEILNQEISKILNPMSNINPNTQVAMALENTFNALVNALIAPRWVVPYSSGHMVSVIVNVAPRLTPTKIK